MKSISLSLVCLLIGVAVFSGCEKTEEEEEGTITVDKFLNTEPNVYLAGRHYPENDISIAKQWKKGGSRNLTDGTYTAWANSVFVSGSDVYVVGSETTSKEQNKGRLNAKLWKNGVAQTLIKDDWDLFDTMANSVCVSGNDVYVVGVLNTDDIRYYYAMLWKNGEIQFVDKDGQEPDSEKFPWGYAARANSIYVSGNDAYVAGYGKDIVPTGPWGNNGVAILWKNGEAQYLTDASRSSMANSVYVSGDDVYVAGCDGDVATVWKNGKAQPLADGTNAHSVFVLGSDVYVAGQKISQDISVAKLWKNGTEQNLDIENMETTLASSVFVSGNDVYVLGGGSRTFSSGYQSRLWKNGELFTFPSYESVEGIFVVD